MNKETSNKFSDRQIKNLHKRKKYRCKQIKVRHIIMGSNSSRFRKTSLHEHLLFLCTTDDRHRTLTKILLTYTLLLKHIIGKPLDEFNYFSANNAAITLCTQLSLSRRSFICVLTLSDAKLIQK